MGYTGDQELHPLKLIKTNTALKLLVDDMSLKGRSLGPFSASDGSSFQGSSEFIRMKFPSLHFGWRPLDGSRGFFPMGRFPPFSMVRGLCQVEITSLRRYASVLLHGHEVEADDISNWSTNMRRRVVNPRQPKPIKKYYHGWIHMYVYIYTYIIIYLNICVISECQFEFFAGWRDHYLPIQTCVRQVLPQMYEKFIGC